MDTRCLIRFMGADEAEAVTIRSTWFEGDPDDDEIFFYGLSRNELKALAGKGFFGEDFEILEVYD